MPGIEVLAPERTDKSSGLSESPKIVPTLSSISALSAISAIFAISTLSVISAISVSKCRTFCY